MAYTTISARFATSVATAGTFTVSYPSGMNKGDFQNGTRHVLMAMNDKFVSPTSITVSFGDTSATVTYNGTTTLPAGTEYFMQLDRGGPATYRDTDDAVGLPYRTFPVDVVRVNLGNPLTADADGIFASAAITSASPITSGNFTGALASSGVVVLDVPRNVVAAWTTSAVMTVTGYDEYGNLMVEASSSGTSLTGKKAFKRITSVAVSTNVTGATVGTGDVLGLPLRLPGTAAARILKELQDGAAATAGTAVAGLAQGTKSTATSADVRGTYDPNAACDGSKVFELILAVADANDLGNPQYAG